jgi:hypothetical protein
MPAHDFEGSETLEIRSWRWIANWMQAIIRR